MVRILLLLMLPISALAWDSIEQLPIPESRAMVPQERGTFNQAVTAMMSGDDATARQLLAPMAASGITDAQLSLATLLSRSQVEDDQKESVKWFYFSANAGVWRSQLEMAKAYRTGRYVAQDRLKAYKWLVRALPLGGIDVLQQMDGLGKELYATATAELDNGKTARAVEILTPLAESGMLPAQEKLAELYAQPPTTQDRRQKMRLWLDKAAAQGSQSAQYALANMILTMPSTDVTEKNYAISLLEKSAAPGKAEAQYQLGRMYMTGDGVAKNTEKGLYYYRIAAEQGHREAQYALGVRYTLGEGVANDDFEAHRWFKQAANEGHAKAQYNLALSYKHGLGTAVQPEKADYWFKKAAAEGLTRGNDSKKAKNSDLTKLPADAGKGTKKNWVEQVNGAKWFAALPKQGFTIQVVTGNEAEAIRAFIQNNKLAENKYFHYVQHSGTNSRHVVQWGYFSSYEEAKKAAIQISKGYTQFKPWIRSVDSVKKSLHS
ncbi:MAG: SPOR domain-containing protein [Gammaproteobacteria bacterium]|nr:SPOR domain-containing protein [Gammaproteobacteria bacterium]